jgi:hypothetical protein
MSASLASSSMKKLRYFQGTSTSRLAPLARCSSSVAPPPENAYLLICRDACVEVVVAVVVGRRGGGGRGHQGM